MKLKYRLLLLASLLFASLAPSNVGAAADMFLKIQGVEGETLDSDHAKEIDVLAWSWGMSQPGSMHAGGGAGKANFQDLSITKYVDKSTPHLMVAISNGSVNPEIKLTVRRPGAEPLDYIVITMKDVMVTSLSTGGSGGEDRLTESVSFNFAKVEYKYIPDSEGPGSSPVEFKFNIAQNIPY